MVNPAETSIVATHFGSTIAVISSIQWLKKSKYFPVVQAGTKVVSRTLSALAAVIVQAGITWSWSVNSSGNHDLLITNLSWVAAFHIFLQFL